MLKFTKAKIHLITDPNMLFTIIRGIRGGECQVIYHHAIANNKYVNPNFNEKTDTPSFNISLDANALYAWCMTEKLPNGEWFYDKNTEKYTIDYILSLDPFGNHYYIFSVDVKYTKELHTRDYQHPLLCDHDTPPNSKIKKLLSTYKDKNNYTISLIMLQYCLKKGIILKKIHKIMHATQETFMKDYITKNNDDRTICSMMNFVFGVNHCKGLNNSLFGKQIQNVKHYSDTRIANSPEKSIKRRI